MYNRMRLCVCFVMVCQLDDLISLENVLNSNKNFHKWNKKFFILKRSNFFFQGLGLIYNIVFLKVYPSMICQLDSQVNVNRW